MSRNLIDRDALIASIPKTNVDIFENCRNCSTLCDWQVRELIEQAELVDAVEVVHGRWLRTDAFPHRIYCSVCFKTYVTNEEVIQGRSWDCPIYAYEAEYCPHCGAKMDGERREEP